MSSSSRTSGRFLLPLHLGALRAGLFLALGAVSAVLGYEEASKESPGSAPLKLRGTTFPGASLDVGAEADRPAATADDDRRFSVFVATADAEALVTLRSVGTSSTQVAESQPGPVEDLQAAAGADLVADATEVPFNEPEKSNRVLGDLQSRSLPDPASGVVRVRAASPQSSPRGNADVWRNVRGGRRSTGR